MYTYIVPLAERVGAYDNMIAYEDGRLNAEWEALRLDLQNLALELNKNGSDVSICLDIALEDLERIFTDRGNYSFIWNT